MTRRTVLSIVGTRPEAVKMAPLIRALASRKKMFRSRVCVTAQHREMLDPVLRLFDIRPDHDLNLMRENQTLAEITAGALTGLDAVVRRESPDWILAQGDTTTVLAAGLVGFYHRVRIGHVEAGLRSGDKYRPYPEEINRRVASVVADAHFAPTEQARQNLLREGVSKGSIFVTGNPVIDALHFAADQPFDPLNSPLAGLPPEKRWVLVTAHRRENFGEPLVRICEALRILAQRYAGRVQWIYPVHMNPNVEQPVRKMLGRNRDITLLSPLEYLPMVHLMKRCDLVLTDSGGLQEEAPGLGKPVLVMREVTERPEGVDAGTVRLVGTDERRIVKETSTLLDDQRAYERMAKAIQPYGDGRAAERIAGILEDIA
ncbi:MAG: non-hydrolyzing UDP-N-acetylglucosamine 2-epimerase [Anaerolineales bacterium]